MTHKSLDNLLEISNSLEAAGKQVSVKVLKTRGPRKGETMQRSDGYGHLTGVGSVRKGDGQTASHSVGSGKGGTITKVCGIGSSMVSNLSKVQSDYQKQIRADRKAAAQDRLMEKIDSALAL